MTISIEDFYKIQKIDEDFDHDFYLKNVGSIEKEIYKFAQPYCRNNNITERERLYYHYFMFGKQLNLFKNIEEMKKNFSSTSDGDECDLDPKSKISVVCACMNRENMLKISLQSWLNFKEVDEFLIIDYSSKEKINFEKIDSRIKVIRIEDQKYYNVAKANNLAILNAKNERVMKMDVDYIINPYFNIFKRLNNILKKDNFVIGNYKLEHADNNLGFLKYLHGFLYIYKKTFETYGRYNENFEGYGWEDSDVHVRLEENGLKKEYIPFDKIYIYHNPHDDVVRSENYKEKDINKTFRMNQNYEKKHNDKKCKWIC